ncbi:hypothetical protein CHS0354_014072 [Potamilus streckersoni]|uniref:Solute carrier organic anion transporter family member n=2 Tax=Potamilus streckersoni TaxID=2493646 RepID=A0AAE0SLZ8_9BIVA|nr:hypothetical protein CHS0354_014072 [Potamilus streckersoni]
MKVHTCAHLGSPRCDHYNQSAIKMTVLKSTRSRDYMAVPQDRPGEEVPRNGVPLSSQQHLSVKSRPLQMEEEEVNIPCGWGPFKPSICQRFRDPKWVLFWLCWAGAIQGMVVNGFVNVVISNIEKRYDLSSTESGTVASCYDIASALLLIPVSYFGGLGCKPRYLGIGVFVMGIGSFVFALPQFTTGLYEVNDSSLRLKCTSEVNGTSSECDTSKATHIVSDYKYVFFLGQLLHGAGAAPLYTLGVTYLDDNLPLRSSAFYVGIFYALAIVGPAIGYLAGGAFLDLYVDINRLDSNSITLPKDNPRYVGAWWIGFLLSGALAVIVAFPIAGFPTSLPGSAKFKAEKEAEVYHRKKKMKVSPSAVTPNGPKKINLNCLKILKSVKVLLLNPTFMFLNLAAACEGNLLSGFATFTPKFIEAQFSLPASAAAQYVGYAAIPAGGGGTFLGGYLVKRFDLHVKGIIRLCLGVTVAVLGTALAFLVYCPNVAFAGISLDYGSTLKNGTLYESFEKANLIATCNQKCHCTEDLYKPVCGVDGVMYFSPCYAGCTDSFQREDQKLYTNCSCVLHDSVEIYPGYEATEGKCESSCHYLPVFMPVFAIMMLLTFVASMPALSATLRCVPHEEKSLALGIQWIIARCLGSIPGPILFGKLIDITCQLWQKKCNEQGSCFFYDNKQMSHNMLAVSLVGKALSSLFFFLALILYKAPKVDENENSKESSPPPPASLSLSPAENAISNQSVYTAVTELSDGNTPATTPNGNPAWIHL